MAGRHGSLWFHSVHLARISWRNLDTKICSCGFYQHLEALKAEGVASAVEADKGFYCFFEMAQHNATLVLPAPASAQHQMSETQVEHTARIANERIFVEHAVKAVKRFKWLQRRVPLIQVDLIDPVLTVAALMANFTHRPFVKKEVRALYPTDPCAYLLSCMTASCPSNPFPKYASSGWNKSDIFNCLVID